MGIAKPKVFNMTVYVTAPKNLKEVLTHNGWRKSMQDEFDAFVRNETWVFGALT